MLSQQIDLRSEAYAGTLFSPLESCDVCIVGTGPAGATISAELAQSGLRVTILESGGFERLPESDELDRIENVGRPRVENQWAVRNRVVGGSSFTWGGRGAPFDEIDFEKRSWIPHSGWPYGLSELGPYLERSASHLGLATGVGFSDERFWEIAPAARYPITPDTSLIRPMYWQFSRDPNESYPFEYMRFGRDLVERLGPTQTLVTGATVLRIEPGSSNRVVFADPVGNERTLVASTIVLCAGGIENTRILLASNSANSAGLGNENDLVGRYLMDHPRGSTATFSTADSRVLQRYLLRHTAQGRLFRAGFRLSPEVQRAEGLVNAAAWLGEVVAPDDPWAGMRDLLRGGSSRVDAAKSIGRNLNYVARGIGDYYIRGNGVPRKLAEIHLDIMCEQRPDPDSRITLSDQVDRFGSRIPRIDWKIHPDEPRSVRRLAELVAQEFGRMGLPVPQLDEWVLDGADFPPNWVDVAHPTGTTRMADDPREGVVDRDGQVHGAPGVFVAGSSVFPTAGHCNPTQMIVALSIRTADAIRKRALTSAVPVTDTPPGPSGKRVLVTGGSGRIGRVLLETLVTNGYQVRATTSRTDLPETPGVEWVPFDFLTAEPQEFDKITDSSSAVIHLAAEIGNASRMKRVNADATKWLAESAERSRVEAFCYTSTVSVYGSGKNRVVREDSPVLTVEQDVASEYLAMDYVRMYGRTKLQGELGIREVARKSRYVIFRPSVVVDIGQLVEIRTWDTFKRFLAAHRPANHIFVRDVADAIVWAMERALAGYGEPGQVETFNLAEDTDPEPTHAAFMKKAYAATGDPRYRVIRVPGIFDWVHDLVRFRTITTRNPLWRMKFSADRLRAAGYRPRFGMAYARASALQALREERLEQK